MTSVPRSRHAYTCHIVHTSCSLVLCYMHIRMYVHKYKYKHTAVTFKISFLRQIYRCVSMMYISIMALGVLLGFSGSHPLLLFLLHAYSLRVQATTPTCWETLTTRALASRIGIGRKSSRGPFGAEKVLTRPPR